MALFRTIGTSDIPPAIERNGLLLRLPQMGDFNAWASLRERSRAFLVPWEPTWPADDLTRTAFRRRLKRYAEDQRTDQAYAFFIFRQIDNVLVGYMSAAVKALIPFAFANLRLHRLEAACIPTNVASIRLLEKCGFVREGHAREYLCINGVWQDHLLYARLPSDPPT
jgi:[ribosomal protein S5]-alanine N-acetyltransferase